MILSLTIFLIKHYIKEVSLILCIFINCFANFIQTGSEIKIWLDRFRVKLLKQINIRLT